MCGYVHRVLARYRAVLTGITAVTRSAVVSGTVVPIRHDQFVSRSLPPLKVREKVWKGVERCGFWCSRESGVTQRALQMRYQRREEKRRELNPPLPPPRGDGNCRHTSGKPPVLLHSSPFFSIFLHSSPTA